MIKIKPINNCVNQPPRCPVCGRYLKTGFKDVYARKSNGTIIIIKLLTAHCNQCNYVYIENYNDKIKSLGLQPY